MKALFSHDCPTLGAFRFRKGAIRAVCEDYRATAGMELDQDRADDSASHKIKAPLLALWVPRGPWESFGTCSAHGDQRRRRRWRARRSRAVI
jgi:hypothetical protein